MGYAKTKLTTIKRKANVGERILITDKHDGENRYENWKEFTVQEYNPGGVHVDNRGLYVLHEEYEVISESTESPTQVAEALTAAHDAIDELRRKAYAEGFDAGRAFEREQNPKLNPGIGDKLKQIERDRIVELAKEDVEKITEGGTINLTFKYGSEQKLGGVLSEVEFEINAEERLVTAILRNHAFGNVIEKGFAICAPDDCFNIHIGRAISLRRALGLKVPAVYLHAPSPTEVRVGDIVRLIAPGYSFDGKVETVRGVHQNGAVLTKESPGICPKGEYEIIDDSREVSE